jgi:hypothetical protein
MVFLCFSPMFSHGFPTFPMFFLCFPMVFPIHRPSPGGTRTGSTAPIAAANRRTTWRRGRRWPARPSWTPWGIQSPRRVAWTNGI